MLTLRIE